MVFEEMIGHFGSVAIYRDGARSVTCPINPNHRAKLYESGYHCFNCGEGGDIFSYVMAARGVDLKGALALVAHVAGVKPNADRR